MGYFTTRQVFFMCSSSTEVEETTKIDNYLLFLERSRVGEILHRIKPIEKPEGGRPEINRYDLFATILYGFAFGSETLRDLETACTYDLRYIYLMRSEKPSYVVFGNFINEYIVPNTELIFSVLMNEIVKEVGIDLRDVYIDGTKIEADANKYKFVWKPTTFHEKLCNKVRQLLDECGISGNVPLKGIFSSQIIAEKLTELSTLISVSNAEDNKRLKKKCAQLKEYLEKALDYEEKERICGPDRNSYYKTDHDATAMTLKTDYYSGLGSNMHAAYNVQVAICKGFACAYYVSQKRNDITELIPTIKQFHRIYNRYPENLCADSGYGSLETYKYLEEHRIGNYVKHQSWEGNVSGKNPSTYIMNDDNTITCLNGKTGYKTEINGRHPKHQGNVFYKINGCKNCGFRQYCKRFQKRKSENYKIFEVNPDLRRYIQQAEKNLLSVKGIEIRVNRSCQAEGSYGVLKEDMGYIRFRRISLPKVTAEYMLTFMGYNIRKLFRFFNGNLKMKYWTAPEDLKPEQFKKPSSKRLTNRVKNKQKKSANQRAKTSYKYKKKGAV